MGQQNNLENLSKIVDPSEKNLNVQGARTRKNKKSLVNTKTNKKRV